MLLAVIAGALLAMLPFGGLYVNSLPSGADVWVDGSYIGRTPLFMDGLREGKHAVTITKTGWRVAEIDEEITAGSVTPATVQLTPVKTLSSRGTLVLHGLDGAARVSIDGGKTLSLRSEYDLPAGDHALVVHEPHARYDRSITIYPGQTTHVVFHEPAPDAHSAVVAPLSDYMPVSAAKLEHNGRVVVRWGSHLVIGHIGDASFLVDGRQVVYDAPAGMVAGKLYLPLDLILAITGSKPK